MAEFGCWPLWNMSNDPSFDYNIDPEDLPISEKLLHDLSAWANSYNDTLDDAYPPDSGFENQELLDAFELDAEDIVNRLRSELEGMEIVYETTASLRKSSS